MLVAAAIQHTAVAGEQTEREERERGQVVTLAARRAVEQEARSAEHTVVVAAAVAEGIART